MRRTILVLIVGAGLLAACASSASPPSNQEAGKPTDAGTAAPAPGSGGRDDSAPLAQVEQRLIVRVGSLELQVTDVPDAYRKTRELALRLGGYVGDSEFATDKDDRPTATVVLRIPADRYDEALDALRPLATKVVDERSQESDVTSQVVDLNARIVNLRATESALQKLMDRATKVSEVLEVQAQLTGVREQIEQLTAQKQLLEKQAALSTLTVILETAAQPVADVAKSWDPGSDVEKAVATLVDLAQGAGRALIWLVIVFLPVVLVGGILAALALFVARRFGPRLRVAVPGGPPAAPPA
jgi:TolA-binding protein